MTLETAIGNEDSKRRIIMDEIRIIIADQLSVECSEIRENSTLRTLNADSLDGEDIIMQIEEKYNINFPRDYMPKGTVGNIVDDVIKYSPKR